MQYSTEEMEALLDLQRQPGWKVLQGWIEQQVRRHTEALVRDDMTVPTRASRLQGRIEGLRDIVRHLEFVAEQYRKRMEE